MACTSGCACEQQLVDAHYPAWQFTLFVTHRFNVSRHGGRCRGPLLRLLPAGLGGMHSVAAETWRLKRGASPLPDPLPMQVTRHEACRIRLTVVDAPRDPPPQQHRFFLNGVMLTHF